MIMPARVVTASFVSERDKVQSSIVSFPNPDETKSSSAIYADD